MSGCIHTSVVGPLVWLMMKKEDRCSRNDEYISACKGVCVHVQVPDECICMLSACGLNCVTKMNYIRQVKKR